MEVDAALHHYNILYNTSNKILTLNTIVADNDFIMKALLQHENNKKDRLPSDIHQHEWIVDPSHRTKVVAKKVYLLASLSKNASSCTKVDKIRFKKYFGYTLKTNKNNSISEIIRESKMVVEHLFNNNEFCDEP